ncbi:MAG TPA: alpha-2-macroglobulin family protein, partial [Polyangiaceae bacterium]|nr:alpha-2-macroglobulin family protein [Polyangiaceae bacterium]
PGEKTRIAVGVTDAAGRPVAGAQVALIVVDESVLALTGYETPDPLEVFYPLRGEGTEDLELRYRIALLRPDLARMQVQARHTSGAYGEGGLDLSAPSANGGGHGRLSRPSVMKSSAREVAYAAVPAAEAAPAPPPMAPKEAAAPGQPGAKGKAASPLTVRLDFDALAAFVPDLRTDARGRAAAKVKLPDSLTRYRVMAVAAAGQNRFGSAEDAIVARLPLMVRASPPRFLNFGDRFALPVVLQNQTDEPLVVDVVARAANLELVGARGLRATVPANDRAEVLFQAAAARPGTARFQVGAASEAGSDASEHELPVWTPATTEAFATYGSLAEGAISQPVRRPRDAVKEWGGLELTTSSTALQGLTDAVLYLVKYPYECNEQISSRVLTIAALRDVLDAFQAQGLPPKAALLASVKEDVKKLAERQHWSGGWDWWRRDREPSPFVSLHVAHALVRAKQKGFPVPEETLRRGLEYVRGIRWRIPASYPQEVRQVLIAYGLYVQRLAQQPDPAAARQLVKDAGGMDRLPLEAIGLIWPVFTGQAEYQGEVTEIRRLVGNRVTETAGNAHFVTGYDDGAWLLLHSDRRV